MKVDTQTILVIEDERSIQVVVRTYLESSGFSVILSDNGPDGIEQCRRQQPVLVILDLNLPGMDGMEVAARIREFSDVYLIILTSRGEENERIAGLRLGADDYLTKPFSPRELVARVETVLRRRRGAPQAANQIQIGRLLIDRDGFEARVGDVGLDLTPTEFKLIEALARHVNRVLTRDQLVDLVWGTDFYGNDRVVDVYVGQVRRKLEGAGAVDVIETIRGVGYKLVDRAL